MTREVEVVHRAVIVKEYSKDTVRKETAYRKLEGNGYVSSVSGGRGGVRPEKYVPESGIPGDVVELGRRDLGW